MCYQIQGVFLTCFILKRYQLATLHNQLICRLYLLKSSQTLSFASWIGQLHVIRYSISTFHESLFKKHYLY